MTFEGKTVVVTGGASGIGAAFVGRFASLGAKTCVLDTARCEVSGTDPDLSLRCDVADEQSLKDALSFVERELGPVDIFVSNAGVLSNDDGTDGIGINADWARCWSVNVMAHVYAARALLPDMAQRGSGHFVTIASAAGLLNQIGDAPYSATKHAAVSFAESLAITYGPSGIKFTLVCPQYVATPLIGLTEADVSDAGTLLTADDVAAATFDAMTAGRFLVLPHQDVSRFAQSRARDHDKWIKGMLDLRLRAIDRFGDARPERFYKLL